MFNDKWSSSYNLLMRDPENKFSANDKYSRKTNFNLGDHI